MEIVYGAKNFSLMQDKSALAIALGNFDGLHLAHKRIIDRVIEIAAAKGLKSAVFLLNPHPVQVLFPGSNLLLLSTIMERAKALESLGIDYLIMEDFNAQFSELTPLSFVRDYLAGYLNAASVVVGYNYSFGSKGSGTPHELLRWGEEFCYDVEVMPPVMISGEIVSSSLIRELIGKGEVSEASLYLGDYFSRIGRVIHGEGRGRRLGFPTANLQFLPELLLPGNGVYLTQAYIGEQRYFSLTNVGKKPTFSQRDEIVVEVYLLNFSGDIYNKELTLKFLQRIRKEKSFAGADLLVRQIQEDVEYAKSLINSMQNTYKGNQ